MHTCINKFLREKTINQIKIKKYTNDILKEITVCHPLNQKALVHNHYKDGNKCYTQDNTNTRETPSM